MIYDQHNFYSNFMNAAGADTNSALQILSDEIAVLVLKHRPTVEYALKYSGVQAAPGLSKKQLTELVADNILENDLLQKAIAQLIVQRHQATGVSMGGYSNATGNPGAGSGALQGLMGAGVPADPVSAVAGAISGITGAIRGGSDKKIAQEQTKQAMIMALTQRQQQASTSSGGKMPTWAVIGLVTVGVGALAGLTYFLVKRNKG